MYIEDGPCAEKIMYDREWSRCSEDGLCPAERMVHEWKRWSMYRENGTCIGRKLCMERIYPYIDGPSTKIMMCIEII